MKRKRTKTYMNQLTRARLKRRERHYYDEMDLAHTEVSIIRFGLAKELECSTSPQKIRSALKIGQRLLEPAMRAETTAYKQWERVRSKLLNSRIHRMKGIPNPPGTANANPKSRKRRAGGKA